MNPGTEAFQNSPSKHSLEGQNVCKDFPLLQHVRGTLSKAASSAGVALVSHDSALDTLTTGVIFSNTCAECGPKYSRFFCPEKPSPGETGPNQRPAECDLFWTT